MSIPSSVREHSRHLLFLHPSSRGPTAGGGQAAGPESPGGAATRPASQPDR